MSHIYEAKITALEGECERLRAANTQLTNQLAGTRVILSNYRDQSARVKRYREALEPDKLFILIAEFAYESDGGPDWIRKLADKISTLALAEPKADSEGA